MCSRPARRRLGSAASIWRIAGRATRSPSSWMSAQALVASAFCSGVSLRVSPEDQEPSVWVARGSPLSFWIPVLVLFPGGPQRRERLGPGAAIGVRIGGRAAGVTTRALLVGGVDLLDFGSVGAVDGVRDWPGLGAVAGRRRVPRGCRAGRRWPGSSGSSAGSGRSTGTRHLPVSAPSFGYVSPWQRLWAGSGSSPSRIQGGLSRSAG